MNRKSYASVEIARYLRQQSDDRTRSSILLLLKAADLVYLPAEKRFALALRRFDWEGAQHGRRRRRLAALHFDRVLAVRSAKLDKNDPDKVLNLLAITFDQGEDPAGDVTLHFSEGAAIRLSVECVEAQMKDLGPVWEAVATPGHPDGA